MKLEWETKENETLIERITQLKDIVKIRKELKDEAKVLTEDNQDAWMKVFDWAERFNIVISKLKERLPKKAEEINKLVAKQEERILFSIQERLPKIPSEIIEALEKAQQEKKVELECLRETEKQVLGVLESQKSAYQICKVAFPELTLSLAVKPFREDIAKTEAAIAELEEMKEELSTLAIFSLDQSKGSSSPIDAYKCTKNSRAEVLSAEPERKEEEGQE
jgi:hypothetical protein